MLEMDSLHLSYFFFLMTITRSARLVEIRWSVCIPKSQRIITIIIIIIISFSALLLVSFNPPPGPQDLREVSDYMHSLIIYLSVYILQQYMIVTISFRGFLADKIRYNLESDQYLW